MKLASLRQGGRDGTLIVVSRDLSRAVIASDVSPTLQSAIDNWDTTAPELSILYESLNANTVADAFALSIDALASPLPRAYQFLDGSVYLYHMEKARKARGAAMPENYKTEPLMYQGLSDRFYGPTEAVPFPDESLEIDYEAELAIIVDDVPMGIDANAARAHIKLVLILNDYTARALTRTELPKGFGFLQSKPSSAFSPVAVSPAELGELWDGDKLTAEVHTSINDRLVGHPNAGVDMFFSYPELIAHAARTRTLSAGTIIGAGAISNQNQHSGFACIAEARVEEQLEYGEPKTPFLKFGDRIRIDIFDSDGRSIFGAIDQTIVQAGTG